MQSLNVWAEDSAGFKEEVEAFVCPTRSEEYVACGGVPADDADPFGVSLQNHDGIREGADQEVIWDLPHLDRMDEEQ